MTTRWKVVTIKQGPEGRIASINGHHHYGDYVAVVDESTAAVICDNASHYAQEVDMKHMPLIAAAPELLEALLGLYDHTKNNYCICGLNTAARAAIAKATGQEPT